MFVKVPSCDCVVLKHVLQDWGDEEAVAILRVCRAAITSSVGNKSECSTDSGTDSGTIVIIESVLGAAREIEPKMACGQGGNADDLGATAHALVDVNAMVMCSGRSRPMAVWHRIAAEAGLVVREVTPTEQLGPSVSLVALGPAGEGGGGRDAETRCQVGAACQGGPA
jgi:hypothetical protein